MFIYRLASAQYESFGIASKSLIPTSDGALREITISGERVIFVRCPVGPLGFKPRTNGL